MQRSADPAFEPFLGSRPSCGGSPLRRGRLWAPGARPRLGTLDGAPSRFRAATPELFSLHVWSWWWQLEYTTTNQGENCQDSAAVSVKSKQLAGGWFRTNVFNENIDLLLYYDYPLLRHLSESIPTASITQLPGHRYGRTPTMTYSSCQCPLPHPSLRASQNSPRT